MAPGGAGRTVRLGRPVRVALGALLVAALLAFSYLASVVDQFPGEVASSSWVQSWRTSWLDSGMKALSVLGVEVVAVPVVVLTALAMALKGLRREGGLLVAATLVAYAMRSVLKLAVARPRPSADLVQVIQQADGYSFPSGHVLHYAVFLGMLVFLLYPSIKPGVGRWLVYGSVVAVLMAMGFSRMYLGVHWLGDVVAGYAIGAVVATGAAWTWRRWADNRERSAG